MEQAGGGAKQERGGAGRPANITKRLGRIENVSNRQVTFSKRRTGLIKKAHELSVLCDAQVAVIVFSSTGRLSDFATPSMPKVLERYQESIGQNQSGQLFQNMEFWKHEAILLKKRIDFLQMQQSILLGEDLSSCQFKDLTILESKLCFAIDKIKLRKMELFQIHAQEMDKQESVLLQENSMLRVQISNMESKKEDYELKSCLSGNGATYIKKEHQCELGVSLHLGLMP